jgi:hypothetical protein
MPNGSGRTSGARRLAWLVVAFSCAAWAGDSHAGRAANPPHPGGAALVVSAEPPAKSAPARKPNKKRSTTGRKKPGKTTPASQPTTAETTRPTGPETYALTRQRLARIPADKRTPDEVAELAALDFVLALAQASGARAVAVVDAAGYDALPLVGPLPERPAKGLYPHVLEPQISARRPIKVDGVPTETLQVLTAEKLKDRAPTVAAWMLTTNDRAVVLAPPQPRVPGWLEREAYLVIRVRAERGTVVAGTLLAALDAGPEVPESSDQQP